MRRRWSGAVALVAVGLAVTGWAPAAAGQGAAPPRDPGRPTRPAGRVELQHHHAAGAPRGAGRQGLPDRGGSGGDRGGDGRRAGRRAAATGLPRRLQPVLVRPGDRGGQRPPDVARSSTRRTDACPRCNPGCRRARCSRTTAAWSHPPEARPVRFRAGGVGYDGPEDRGLAERCILGFNTGPPMLPSGFYNDYMQLFQGPDHVVILNEMVHDARIVPLDGRPPLTDGVRQWMGSSRGHWEGHTLVVTTTNFSDRTSGLQHVGHQRGRNGRDAAPRRALHPRRRRHAALRVHRRRSGDVHAPVHGRRADDPNGRAALRVRLPRGELRPAEHPARGSRGGAGGRRGGRAAVGVGAVETPRTPVRLGWAPGGAVQATNGGRSRASAGRASATDDERQKEDQNELPKPRRSVRRGRGRGPGAGARGGPGGDAADAVGRAGHRGRVGLPLHHADGAAR